MFLQPGAALFLVFSFLISVPPALPDSLSGPENLLLNIPEGVVLAQPSYEENQKILKSRIRMLKRSGKFLERNGNIRILKLSPVDFMAFSTP